MARTQYDFSQFQTVTFHGDSFTKGLYSSGEFTCYRELLGAKLVAGGGGSTITRIATTGAKMAAAATLSDAEAEVIAHDPDLVILAYGINDVASDPPSSEVDFTNYAQDVMDAYAGRVVLVAGICWCGWGTDAAEYALADTYNDILAAEAASRSYLWTDLWALTLGRGDYLARSWNASFWDPGYAGDNFHYGDRGHRAIFDAHYATLAATLPAFSRSAASRVASAARSAAGARSAA